MRSSRGGLAIDREPTSPSRLLRGGLALALTLFSSAAVAAPAIAASNPGTGETGFFTFRPVDAPLGAEVNVASGNLLVAARDLGDSAANYHVVVDRAYNSLASGGSSLLSPRWTFAVGLTTTLTFGTGTAQLNGPSGYSVTLTQQADGSYTGPAGFDGVLHHVGSTWVLNRPTENDSFTFDSSGQLIATQDAAGREFTVTTTSAGGRTVLSSYGTSSGRRANLSYNGDGTVRELDDPSSGHAYYSYTSGGLTAFQRADGELTAYSYDANGLLNRITGPDGSTVTTRNLADGRVSDFTLRPSGQAAQVTSFEYFDGYTIVTGPDGTRTEYQYDQDYRVTASFVDTTPPPASSNLSLVYDTEEQQAVFGYDQGDDPTPGSGTAGTEARFKLPGASDYGPWTSPGDVDDDNYLVDAQPGDTVQVQTSAFDSAGNFAPVSTDSVIVQPDPDAGGAPFAPQRLAAVSGPNCYSGDTAFDFPFTSGDGRIAKGASSANLPDCRVAKYGTQDGLFFYRSTNPTANPYRPRKASGYANLGDIAKTTPPTSPGGAPNSTPDLNINPAYGGRRVWPVYNSLNTVMAWVEEYVPADGQACTAVVNPGVCSAKHWIIYNSDGDATFDPATDTEEARNVATPTVYLSVQGRGCMVSNRDQYDVVFLRGSGLDTEGSGRLAKVRGFMRVSTDATLSGLPEGIAHGSYSFHGTNGAQTVNFNGKTNQQASAYYDTKCSNGQLAGSAAPTTADPGQILGGTLNQPFIPGPKVREESPLPKAGAKFINFNQYSNNNGFPDPNVSGSGLTASRVKQVYLLASSDATDYGGIVRSIVPVAQAFTQVDHFPYADPNGYCAKNGAYPTSAAYLPLAKFALVRIDGVTSSGTAIEGWVAANLYASDSTTRTQCNGRL